MFNVQEKLSKQPNRCGSDGYYDGSAKDSVGPDLAKHITEAVPIITDGENFYLAQQRAIDEAPYATVEVPPPTYEPLASHDNMDLSKGGVKYDGDKPTMELLAPEFLIGTAEVLAYGKRKYAARNWEAGMRWGRPLGGLLRHICAWMSGQDIDPESGLHHLDHAACCLMFLRAYVARKIGEDDRKRDFSRGSVQEWK